MFGFAMLMLGWALGAVSKEVSTNTQPGVQSFRGILRSAPDKLRNDVDDCSSREFAMPIIVTSGSRDEFEHFRLFVSDDQGKTWKHKKDYKPSAKRAIFRAPRDGQYWFARQVVTKNGETYPARERDLVPARKVLVKSVSPASPPAFLHGTSNLDLLKEIGNLRKTINALDNRVKVLESDSRQD